LSLRERKEASIMSQKQKIAGAQHERPLPRVRSFSAYLMRGSALVLVLTAVGLPVNFALGGDSNSTVSALLEVGEIMSLLCLVIAALARRGEKKAIHQILTDRHTVHWTYSPAEWQRFTTQAWRQSIRSILVVTGIVWVILIAVFLASVANVPSGLALGTGMAILMGLLFFLMAVVDLQRRRRHTTSDVYINRVGIVLSGWYHPLRGWMGGLNRVTYKAGDPSVLSFDIGWGRGRRVLKVPVPHGREAEAEQVAWSLY
jgi:hypothetical protein